MYEEKTYENLLNKAMSDIDPKAGVQLGEGYLSYNALSALAYELEKLYVELNWVIGQGHVQTADLEHLIRICDDRGITRKPATYAVVSAQGDAAIPEGTRIRLKGYIFDVGDVLDETTHLYKAVCETAGTGPNGISGKAEIVDYVQGLSWVTINELLIPGQNIESEDSLRQRYYDSFDTTGFGGNARDYRKKVLEIDGVGAVRVTRAWNKDIHPGQMIPKDEVTAWYEKNLQSFPEEVRSWLTAVYTAAHDRLLTVGGTVLVTILNSELSPASDELVKEVQEALDPDDGEGTGIAPIGHLVTVRSAEAAPVTVSAKLSFSAGYTFEQLTVAIDTEISGYLKELRSDWQNEKTTTVRIRQIENRILNIRGILDITGLTVNGQTENIELDAYSVPTYGGFTNG